MGLIEERQAAVLAEDTRRRALLAKAAAKLAEVAAIALDVRESFRIEIGLRQAVVEAKRAIGVIDTVPGLTWPWGPSVSSVPTPRGTFEEAVKHFAQSIGD